MKAEDRTSVESELRRQAMASHPDFPWLDVDRPDGVGDYLRRAGWLEPGERFRSCERAGEGNMNLTLRIRTDRRRFVLKQARPWVEKYDTIPAPWDRSLSEQRFYQRVADIRPVSSRMPRLLGVDPAARILLLEDLPGARDMSDLYSGNGVLAPGELEELAAYLRALHTATRDAPEPDISNRAMRALNHEHIFVIPLDPENGLALDSYEDGLERAARRLAGDDPYRAQVTRLGERYLSDGPCLVHGDYFPGSWLRSDVGLRIIDPEFGFWGDPELDVGFALAHLALAARPAAEARRWLEAYAKDREAPPLDAPRVARYAAVEVMRRLIGVAQLPIPPGRGDRLALLERSRRVMLDGEAGPLFPETK
jgi:5-methylthioribose kinase